MRNRTIFFTVLLAVTIFFSCGNISDKKIRIAYANWAEGIAGHLSGQGDSLGARIQNRTFECGHSSHIHFVGKRQDRRVHGQLAAGDPCRLFPEIQ